MRIEREKEETNSIKEILNQLNYEDEDTKFEEEVDEVMRLAPYMKMLDQSNRLQQKRS